MPEESLDKSYLDNKYFVDRNVSLLQYSAGSGNFYGER